MNRIISDVAILGYHKVKRGIKIEKHNHETTMTKHLSHFLYFIAYENSSPPYSVILKL